MRVTREQGCERRMTNRDLDRGILCEVPSGRRLHHEVGRHLDGALVDGDGCGAWDGRRDADVWPDGVGRHRGAHGGCHGLKHGDRSGIVDTVNP